MIFELLTLLKNSNVRLCEFEKHGFDLSTYTFLLSMYKKYNSSRGCLMEKVKKNAIRTYISNLLYLQMCIVHTPLRDCAIQHFKIPP